MLNDSWWGWQKWDEKSLNLLLDLQTAATQELSSPIILHAFQSNCVGSEYVFVDCLNEVFVELLDLRFLIRPLPGPCRTIHEVDFFVKLNQIFDGVVRELESDLIRKNQVDVNNVGLNVEKLESEEGVYQRMVVLLNLAIRCSFNQQRAQRPNCRRR